LILAGVYCVLGLEECNLKYYECDSTEKPSINLPQCQKGTSCQRFTFYSPIAGDGLQKCWEKGFCGPEGFIYTCYRDYGNEDKFCNSRAKDSICCFYSNYLGVPRKGQCLNRKFCQELYTVNLDPPRNLEYLFEIERKKNAEIFSNRGQISEQKEYNKKADSKACQTKGYNYIIPFILGIDGNSKKVNFCTREQSYGKNDCWFQNIQPPTGRVQDDIIEKPGKKECPEKTVKQKCCQEEGKMETTFTERTYEEILGPHNINAKSFPATIQTYSGTCMEETLCDAIGVVKEIITNKKNREKSYNSC